MESLTMEDVAMNFTMEEWALLNPSQKMLYRDVMWETFMNMTAIGRTWEKHQIEEYKYFSRNLRNEEVAKWSEYKPWNQYEDLFLWASDANMDMQQAAFNPVENFAWREPPIGHLSQNIPMLPHIDMKSDEYLGFDDHLFTFNEQRKTCHDLQSFLKHAKTQTGNMPYQYEQHGKTYSESSIITYLVEKTIVEKKSMEACRAPSGIQIYESIDTGKKPYICKQCGKAFNTHRQCMEHERIHTNQKPYVCKKCGKAFTLYRHCKQHERVHTGEKPYICKAYI